MLISTGLKSLGNCVLLVSSIYKFTKKCIKIYNTLSSTKAFTTGTKKVTIDCTPLYIKYSALCAALLFCGVAACSTKDPNFMVSGFECRIAIVES